MLQPDRPELLRGFRLDLKLGVYGRRRSDARQPALKVVQPTKTTPRALKGRIHELVSGYSIRPYSSYTIEDRICAHIVLLMGWGRPSLKDGAESLSQSSQFIAQKPFAKV